MNQYTLKITDKFVDTKFRELRYNSLQFPFIFHLVAEMVFKSYILVLDETDATDWDSFNHEHPHIPTKKFRMITTISSLSFDLITIMIFLLAKYKKPWMFEWICSMFVLNICV